MIKKIGHQLCKLQYSRKLFCIVFWNKTNNFVCNFEELIRLNAIIIWHVFLLFLHVFLILVV